jgi:UDP-2,3-diacylglucosamine pyrophosphatase LpxH
MTLGTRDPTGLARVDLGEIASFAVVSDVHVRTPDDERSRLLTSTLDALEPTITSTLFLLGDVFDFIDVGSSFHRRHWRSIFDALRRVRSRGVRVFLCEGNHDFGFEHALHPDLRDCFDGVGDLVFRLRHSVVGEVWLRHGDDVVCPPSYTRFRALVKSRSFQSATGVVPGLFTHALFSAYARLSRTRDKYRALDPAFFSGCVDDYLARARAEGLGEPALFVLGHVHVNVDDLRGRTRVVAGPDWFTAPVLTVVSERGTLERRWLRSGARAAEYRF